MPIRTYTATLIIPAAGTAGSCQFGNTPVYDPAAQTTLATGTPVNGRLYDIQIAFGGGTATALSIKTQGQGGPQLTLLSLANVNSDNWYAPRQRTQDNSGVSIAGSLYDQYAVDDNVIFAITSGGTAGTYIAKMLMYQ